MRSWRIATYRRPAANRRAPRRASHAKAAGSRSPSGRCAMTAPTPSAPTARTAPTIAQERPGPARHRHRAGSHRRMRPGWQPGGLIRPAGAVHGRQALRQRFVAPRRRACSAVASAGRRLAVLGLDGRHRDRATRARHPRLTPEVGAAEGAQRPVRLGQSVARRADPMEPSAAVRADEPLGVDAITADRTELVLLDLGKQRLLGQAALVDLGQRLARPHDQVQHDREQEEERREEDDERGGEVRKDRVLGPRLHVAERPVRRAEPEQDDVDHDQLACQLHDRVAQESVPELANRFENRVHLPALASPAWGSAPLGRRREC